MLRSSERYRMAIMSNSAHRNAAPQQGWLVPDNGVDLYIISHEEGQFRIDSDGTVVPCPNTDEIYVKCLGEPTVKVSGGDSSEPDPKH